MRANWNENYWKEWCCQVFGHVMPRTTDKVHELHKWIAELDAENERLRRKCAEKDAENLALAKQTGALIGEMTESLVEKDAEIERLRQQLLGYVASANMMGTGDDD